MASSHCDRNVAKFLQCESRKERLVFLGFVLFLTLCLRVQYITMGKA